MSAGLSGLAGARSFWLLVLGQFVSLLGTAMTSFALTNWAWVETKQATVLAEAELLSFGTLVLLSPVVGVVVDRYDRRWAVITSCLAAAAATLALLSLQRSVGLCCWHLYLFKMLLGAFMAFESCALSAAITLLVPKRDYAKANGVLAFAFSMAAGGGPTLAAFLLSSSRGLSLVLTIDCASYLLSAAAAFLANVPDPTRPIACNGPPLSGSLVSDLSFGLRYIWARPGLRSLQLVWSTSNFLSMFGIVGPAMILVRSNNDPFALGSVLTSSALGALAGSALAAIGGSRAVVPMLLELALAGLVGQAFMGLVSSTPLWCAAAFFCALLFPITSASSQALWQAKISPAIQGRVFAARRLTGELAGLLALALAGPLADGVFEPAMASHQSQMSRWFAGIVGVGPGSGMAIMLVLTGLARGIVSLFGVTSGRLRQLEQSLPDHE